MFKQGLKHLLFFTLLSFLTGTASSIFLLGLQYVKIWQLNWNILWFLLPLTGVIFQYLKKSYPKIHSTGTNDYIDLIQNKEKKTSAFFSCYILACTWLSHLAGASVGREGTAVQMGASFSDTLGSMFHFSNDEKSIWIRAGIAGGFASVFGTPWAGAFFGLEISNVGQISWKSILPCFATAILSNWVSLHVYDTNHLIYPAIFLPVQTSTFWLQITILGLFLGIIAYLYKALESNIYKWSEQLPKQFILKGIISGLIIYLFLQNSIFQTSIGLGAEKLLEPFSKNSEPFFFLKKLIATCLSIGLGFKGGEATPLFLIGSHAAASLSEYLSIPISLAASIGFVTLYTGLAKTPITGMILGMELFAPEAWYIYLLTSIIVMYASGKKGLFSSQTWEKNIPKPLY